MKGLSEFNTLTENKTLVAILLFSFLVLGEIAFYCPNFHNLLTYGLVSLIFIILIIQRHFKLLKNILPPLFLVLLYFIFCFGYTNSKLRYVEFDDFSKIDFAKDIVINGVIENNPQYINTTNTCKFSLIPYKVSKNGKSFDINRGKILVSIKDYRGKKLKYGNKLTLKGVLTTPNDANNPSEFNYRKFLNNKGILKILYVKNEGVIENKEETVKIKDFEDFKRAFIIKMNKVRDDVILKHSKYIKSPNLEILGGVVFGDEAINPPDEVKGSFINSGLLHLLAASGLNVALILSIWFCLIHFLNVPYKLKYISGIIIVFLYTIMTGFPPSIVRASVMLLLILIGKLIYRETNGTSLIFMAGFIILLFKPEFITNTGFQLSFLVTAGLIICIPCITSLFKEQEKVYIKKISNQGKILQFFLSIFSPISLICLFMVPFVAQIWASPIQAYYFNTFSTYSILANIAVVPFIGIISFLGFISTAICFIPKISDYLIYGLDLILDYVIKIVLNISNYFANLDNSIITVASPKIITIILFYIFVIYFFNSIKDKFKVKLNNFMSLIFLVFCIISLINISNAKNEVIFFSVGNGDSCLIKTKENKYILIDTGRYIYKGLTSAKTILLEYFYDNNIKEIDTMIVSHFDSDHSGGVVDILKKVKVDNLIMPKLSCTSINSCEIKDYIEKNNIHYSTPKTNEVIEYEKGIKIKNFKLDDKKLSKNDTSIITLIEIEDKKLLFLGDVTLKTYKKFDNFIPNNITILKASHHGAKNTVDDEMIKKLSPEYSIISVGKNPYGHPDKYTYSILNQNSNVLSTRELGAIKFRLDKKIEALRYNKFKNKFEKIIP